MGVYIASLQFSNNVGGSVLICIECDVHISGRLVSSLICGQSVIYNRDFMFYDTRRVLVFGCYYHFDTGVWVLWYHYWYCVLIPCSHLWFTCCLYTWAYNSQLFTILFTLLQTNVVHNALYLGRTEFGTVSFRIALSPHVYLCIVPVCVKYVITSLLCLECNPKGM